MFCSLGIYGCIVGGFDFVIIFEFGVCRFVVDCNVYWGVSYYM